MSETDRQTARIFIGYDLTMLDDAYNALVNAYAQLLDCAKTRQSIQMRTWRSALGECERPTVEEVARLNYNEECAEEAYAEAKSRVGKHGKDVYLNILRLSDA